MPIFERPPLETLAMARDRWTPVYLEHGRLEVDDSSVKWIGADGLLCRIPAATVSAILLGPGTTITHAAVKACAELNTPLCWTGADGIRFYASGITPTHDNQNPKRHAAAWADRKRRTAIARAMFKGRFPEVEVEKYAVPELRGMEGIRVRTFYGQLGLRYGVTWKGRDYDKSNWNLADNINRAVSAATASLYALCSAVITSMGYLPQLGFIHEGGTLPFVYDIADLYKHETALPAAFQAIRQSTANDEELTRTLLKQLVEDTRLLQRLPRDLAGLFTEPSPTVPLLWKSSALSAERP